ncbi:Gfo/Idh/MocA family oxidoreductase [Chitinophaga horti]|uniref:Gfo/Idh/MocA family oxidoreductase n=1 Tax=Chitinophaga horti TaxID=2920382 RepID=A0ABY6JC83_9BACT|nr:Gfo/Idh/MocA family oxidoreductase [Chitinophaga horti]UYQ95814.1 Gfo/Idh/MocA family oxidoreductase [Chitinophaga horti]
MTHSRRQFLSTASMLMAGAALPSALHGFHRVAAADKLNVGAIGINGMGWSDLNSILKVSGVNCIGICDVDKSVIDKRLGDLAKQNQKPTVYSDYRKLLENKDIDAVIIGTPDHWHCLQMADAVAAGKHVYVEKPIGNSIAECNVMVAAQEKSGKAVQVGQWQRSQKHFNDAIAFVHSGKLGQVRLVKVWAYMGWMKPVPVQPDGTPPAGVDYAQWLGPAEKRPFNPNRFHFNFRWFWDYAGGLMTDWGVHLIDYALYGMKAKYPKSVMASGGKFAYRDDAAETPDTLTTVYEFDGFNMLWEHATGIDNGPYGRTHGIAFVGNNGTLVLDRGGWEVIPEKGKMEAVPYTKSVDNGLDLHTKNFVDVIRSGNLNDLKTPIQTGALVAVNAQMGNIAYKTGKKVYWDGQKGQFTDKDANKYLSAGYHNGYKLPKV